MSINAGARDTQCAHARPVVARLVGHARPDSDDRIGGVLGARLVFLGDSLRNGSQKE